MPKDKHKDIKIIKGNNEGNKFVKKIWMTLAETLTIWNIFTKEKNVVNKTRKSVK